MSGALIFNGSNSLDFQDIRVNVIRIPEVINAVREAQGIWDTFNPNQFDFTNFLGSEDHVFLNNIKLRNFASTVVQVGLLRRYLKKNGLPEFLIGTVNGDSALKVALNQVSFFELVAESEAMPKERFTIVPKDAPLLTGVQLDDYAVYRKIDEKFVRLPFETRDVYRMVETLIEKNGLRHLVFIGPGTWNRVVPPKVTSAESIDIDPSLSWFWARAKSSSDSADAGAAAVAN